MWKMEVWLYKGWVAREGRGSGTCRRVARRLVCCFFDAVPSDATTSFIYFQISEIQVQTSPFCFLKWLRHLQKIDNQQRHDLCFANNARGNSRTPLSADSPRALKYSHLLFSFPSIQQVFPTTLSLLYTNPNQHPNTYSQCLLVAKARLPLRLSPLPDLPRPVSSVSVYLIDHTLIILLL